MTLSENQLIAIENLVMGHDHKQAASAANVARSTLYRWLQNDEFQEGLHSARSRIRQGHEQALDSYKLALLEAAKQSGECINVLLEIAKNPDTRTSDRLKAVEMLLQQPQKLMGLLAENAVFPEEKIAQQEEQALKEQRWRQELIAAGWREIDTDEWLEPNIVSGLAFPSTTERAYKKMVTG